MNRDPNAWARLGGAIRASRNRKRLTRDQLAQLIKERGGAATARSIGSLERGVIPKTGNLPPTLEPTVGALGWRVGWADRILNGEDPDVVLAPLHEADSAPTAVESKVASLVEGKRPPTREDVFEALPHIYEFGRNVVALGGDQRARDIFEQAVHMLLDSLPGSRPHGRYGLAAYRPHAEGEGPAPDDAERILRAMANED